MPTQRSFLGNFLAAFRAHSQSLPKASPSISSSATAASAATIWTAAAPQQRSKSPSETNSSETSLTGPKTINAKTNPYHTSTTAAAASDRQLVSSLPPLQHNVSPQTHLPRRTPSPGLPVYGPSNKPQPSYPSVQDVRRSRRGSDSSSEGFREVKGRSEKWFIGGRTAGGEEKYYKLSMIKRDRSADRISTDQLSL